MCSIKSSYRLHVLGLQWQYIRVGSPHLAFFIELLEICSRAFILLVGDREKLYCALFGWNVCTETRNEFHTKIVNVKNEAEFKAMILYLGRFMKKL